MALRGNTQDYGLADVLQLIAKAGKSGILRCENDVDDIRLLIDNGWIVNVETSGRPNDAKLGTRLVRAGVITDGELGDALVRRAQTSEPITEILLDEGLATIETLKHYASLLATDTLFGLFTWSTGTYEFMEGAVSPPRTFVQAVSLDEMLMQGIVLMDEWPQILDRIPSGAARVERRWPLPPETEPNVDALFGGFDEGSSDTPPRADIGSNERMIHDLCRAGVEVQAIVDQAPFHRFETYRCLSRLIGEHFLRLDAED